MSAAPTAPAPRPAPAELPLSFLRGERLGQAVESLAKYAAGPDRLRAGAELLTVLLEDALQLTAACWSLRVALGLVTRPDEEIPVEHRPRLVGPRLGTARRRRHAQGGRP